MDQIATERLISLVNKIGTDVARIKGAKPTLPGAITRQQLLMGKISLVNSSSPETYSVRVLTGNQRLESNWVLTEIMSSDANVALEVDDYVVVLLNESGVSYALGTGGGGSGIILVTGFSLT